MKLEGVIINTIDYKETSKIVHLYTNIGKISVQAVGSNNPKKGLLGFTTIGNTVSFVTTDSKLPKLTDYEVINSLFKISEDLLRVKCFMVILDIIKNIPEDTNHEKTYPFIKKTFSDLLTENPKKLLSIFLIKMLYVFGIAPNLKSCVSCGMEDIKFLDLKKGGAICKNCSNLNNQDELYIWKEYYFLKKEIKDYTDCNYDALLKNIKEYYSSFASLNLKLQDIIKK